MSKEENDAKYSKLILELNSLTKKLSSFLNGPVTGVVNTDNGPVQTLASIVAGLQKYKYVQKIIDHRLYADMLEDTLSIEDGLLVRIWGDEVQINGIYQKVDGVFNKLNYQTLTDLL